MLPFTSSGSKMTPRHHVSGYSNGYPRGNTFEISPHRYVVISPDPLSLADKRLPTVDSHPEAQRHHFEDEGDYFFDSA